VNKCKECGAPCQDDRCPDCRYRSGGPQKDGEAHTRDVVEVMVRHSAGHFRDGFTSDQLQQVSPSER
jgi:hypothetical protein